MTNSLVQYVDVTAAYSNAVLMALLKKILPSEENEKA